MRAITEADDLAFDQLVEASADGSKRQIDILGDVGAAHGQVNFVDAVAAGGLGFLLQVQKCGKPYQRLLVGKQENMALCPP